MVAIIDYGAGNIKSVENAVRYLGQEAVLTRDPAVILSADHVILPGVGAFGGAMIRLRKYGLDNVLPYEVEHIYPDYSLYPEQTKDTAFGFLTRGCPRGCGFCHVKSKPLEGRCSHKVADLLEFWNGQKNIVLCDPNILACPQHMELLQQLADSKAKVNFNQGLDIRLVNDRNLELIKRIKLQSIHFAFDRWQDKDLIEPKLRQFAKQTGFNRHKGSVMVYILTNYDTTLEQDLYRIQLCRELNFSPYPMIYDKEHCDPIYRKLQRWCNNFIFWKVPTFEDYKRSAT